MCWASNCTGPPPAGEPQSGGHPVVALNRPLPLTAAA
jgi:hypothetical protein